jgi:opacity protein-like surface antigen
MKKLYTLIACAGLLAASAFAADNEVTITGEGMCAKCALHETEKCQNAIQTQEDGKTVTYYLTQNDVSKNFHHDNLCKQNQKVTATGTVSEKDGKKVLTVSKIELAK